MSRKKKKGSAKFSNEKKTMIVEINRKNGPKDKITQDSKKDKKIDSNRGEKKC